MRQYVVVLQLPDDELEEDDSIENACRIINESFAHTFYYEDSGIPLVRPLSEVIAS